MPRCEHVIRVHKAKYGTRCLIYRRVAGPRETTILLVDDTQAWVAGGSVVQYGLAAICGAVIYGYELHVEVNLLRKYGVQALADVAHCVVHRHDDGEIVRDGILKLEVT